MLLPVVMILMRLLDPFVFRPPILEPNFDLRLGQCEAAGELDAVGARDVLASGELRLQTQSLLSGERRALPAIGPRLPPPPPGHWSTPWTTVEKAPKKGQLLKGDSLFGSIISNQRSAKPVA